MFRNILITSMCLLFVGCKSTSVYVPKSLVNAADTDLVTLKADSEHDHGIFVAFDERLYISSINGESTYDFMSMDGYPETAKIPIGNNKIELKYIQGQVSGDSCVVFKAEKGKVYLATKKRDGMRVLYWIIEEGTNNKVSKPCIE
ncbi:hypothetical protein Q4575_00015 [Psychrosphaera sp. 1_MG-2023]|uniref:hypothetical protein n=1 Tax=Psychrosphaera sp. 1_MG-2023 TaxID=3062643 RepID=UPI0026E32C86|nr:hypothetical protein [Psychrosphaera sp. 1_MG-2023]MDO6717760.1 hypothetical protein [Psychrosphaera sp. 1_MG-2023]